MISARASRKDRRTAAGVVIAVSLLATALVVALFVNRERAPEAPSEPTQPPAEPTEPPAFEPVTWAPPVGWEEFTPIELPPTGGTLELDSETDFLISARQVRTEAVHIRGGRNVVWIGGHVRISETSAFASPLERRAIVISDAPDGDSSDGRIVHLEGLLLDGSDLAEGINTNAPSAVVQLQNIHVGLVRIRGADDRDGTGGYEAPSHPDIVQVWGSKKELRIDGLTGRSNYQGIFLNEDVDDPRRGPNLLRRVDLQMVETDGEDGRRYAGHRGLTWTPEASGRLLLDPGTVWLQHHENSGWTKDSFRRVAYRDEAGELVDEPVTGASEFGDNLYPSVNEPAPYGLLLETDSLGLFGFWPEEASVEVAAEVPAVQNFDESEPGRIYAGRPPGGSYVPAHAVGLAYNPPGYVGENTTRR
jgi:hypothetical protein